MKALDRIRASQGAFVTGTDTGVGKTVVSAILAATLDADYWKPIQAGTEDGGDSEVVRRLLAPAPVRIHAPRFELSIPRSPHEAARRDGVTIRLRDLESPESDRPLVIEGAGGLLVPLNEHDLVIDLARDLDRPIVLVARSGLGTINHTLLSLEALRARGLDPLGVILNGPPDPENREAITKFGAVPVILEVPPLDPLDVRPFVHALRGHGSTAGSRP